MEKHPDGDDRYYTAAEMREIADGQVTFAVQRRNFMSGHDYLIGAIVEVHGWLYFRPLFNDRNHPRDFIRFTSVRSAWKLVKKMAAAHGNAIVMHDLQAEDLTAPPVYAITRYEEDAGR